MLSFKYNKNIVKVYNQEGDYVGNIHDNFKEGIFEFFPYHFMFYGLSTSDIEELLVKMKSLI